MNISYDLLVNDHKNMERLAHIIEYEVNRLDNRNASQIRIYLTELTSVIVDHLNTERYLISRIETSNATFYWNGNWDGVIAASDRLQEEISRISSYWQVSVIDADWGGFSAEIRKFSSDMNIASREEIIKFYDVALAKRILSP